MFRPVIELRNLYNAITRADALIVLFYLVGNAGKS